MSRVSRLSFRLGEEEWTRLLERLAGLRYRAALVGPCGTGKTTLLRELERRLERRGFRLLCLRAYRDRDLPEAEWRRALGQVGPDTVLSVDGFDHLSWLRRARLARASRAAAGLVVTTHAHGLLPTVHLHRTDPDLLEDLVAEAVGSGQARQLRPGLDRLFRDHRGNLRDCLRSLYDLWGRHDGPCGAGALG